MKAGLVGVGVGVRGSVEDSADFEQVFGSLADLPVLVVESPLECEVCARVIEGSECKCRPSANGDSVVARDKNCFEAFRVADGTQGYSASSCVVAICESCSVGAVPEGHCISPHAKHATSTTAASSSPSKAAGELFAT